MAITLTNAGTTLVLDPDLYWSDELDWAPVTQSESRSITGALILQARALQAGRPITLQPEADDSAWMPLSVVLQLRAWAAVPGLELVLELRGVARTVVFRHGTDGAGAVSARPVEHFNDTQPADWYLCTLRFLEIS